MLASRGPCDTRPMRFQATIEAAGKTAAGIHVPDEVVAALGSGKRPPVRVTLNSYTYRSTVAVISGRFMVGVSNEVRAAAGVAAGDTLVIDLELDTQPREVAIPPELAAALERDAAAKQRFEGLSYSNRLRLASPIGDAKTEETRQRNLAKAMSELADRR